MTQLAETIATTLASGILTAVGAYSAIVWKLTKRVTILEHKLQDLDEDLVELKKSRVVLEKRQAELRVELVEGMSALREDVSKQLGTTSSLIMSRLDDIHTKLSEELGDFRTNCAERTSRYVPRAAFERYTKEEERRWQEFYRAVGKLEAVIDRAMRNSMPPPPRLVNKPDPRDGE